jgi:hypothetical protein
MMDKQARMALLQQTIDAAIRRGESQVGFTAEYADLLREMGHTQLFVSGALVVLALPAQAKRANIGKVDYSLLPVNALTAEAWVWAFGEEKYGRDNWKKLWGDNTTAVVMASLLRHAFAILEGETHDKESGLPHAAHIRCNAAMLIEYQEQPNE